MVAGNTSFSSVASSSFFTNSKLFFHVGILKISCPFAVRGFRFQNLGYVSMGPSLFPPHPALQLPPEIKYHQLGIFHLPKENWVTHPLPEHLLLTPSRLPPPETSPAPPRIFMNKFLCLSGFFPSTGVLHISSADGMTPNRHELGAPAPDIHQSEVSPHLG